MDLEDYFSNSFLLLLLTYFECIYQSDVLGWLRWNLYELMDIHQAYWRAV